MTPVRARLLGWRASLEESGTPFAFVYSFPIRWPNSLPIRWPIQALFRIRKPIPEQVKPSGYKLSAQPAQLHAARGRLVGVLLEAAALEVLHG